VKNNWTLPLALISVVAIVPVAVAAEGYGGCFRVDLAAPFILPDGSLHDPGVLTICTDRPLNPVAGTHRMAASGASVGRIVSRRVRSESAQLDAPRVVFARTSNGTLRLLGYVEPAGNRVRAFSFAEVDPPVALGTSSHADQVVLAAK
jgi:hypothetical protein